MKNHLLEAALAYARRGISVLPVKPKGKEPLTNNGVKDATTDEKKIRAWWKKWPKANIGLVPGGPDLVVVDIDGPEGEEFAQERGWLDIETPRVVTDKGLHLYFKKTSEAVVPNAKPHPQIDLRSNNGYVLGPPSVHPSGHVYRWESEDVEFAPLPEDVIPAVEEGKKRARAVGGKVTKGGRNSRLLSLAGGLRRLGVGEDGLAAALTALNDAECEPPLSKREVARIAASVASQYQPDPKMGVIELINLEYAHLLNGGKSMILRTREDGTWDTIRWTDFKRLLQNWPRVRLNENKTMHAADFWLACPQRLDYPGGIVFEPGELRTKNAYNLFKGWAYEPREGGRCDILLDHIRNNVARRDSGIEKWVLGFFAHILQSPARKIGTALALRGRQGTGKSIVGECFGKLMGTHYQTASDRRYLVGNFNAHLEETLLFQLEEAIWPGDKSAEGILKDLITGKRHLRERKYQDPIQVDNHIRIFITSNEEWVVPAGPLERRFTVLEMGEGRIQDDDYFRAMMHQLEEEDGYAALLHFALNYSIDKEALAKPIRTEALSEQIAHSFSAREEWWYDILNEGAIPWDEAGEARTLTDMLYKDYRKVTAHTEKRPLGTARFGSWLKEMVPGLHKRRLTESESGERRAFYEFPSLEECRRAFDGQAAWPEPSKWQPRLGEF